MKQYKIIFTVFIAALSILANTDSLTSLNDSTVQSSVWEKTCKLVINIRNKNSYETLLTIVGADTTTDTISGFQLESNTEVIQFNYSGFKDEQLIRVNFIDGGVLFDSLNAPKMHIIKHKYVDESKALLLYVELDSVSWKNRLEVDESLLTGSREIRLNNKTINSRNFNNINLNRYDINSIEFIDHNQTKRRILLDYKDPYGIPELIIVDGVQCVLREEPKKKLLVISIKSLSEKNSVKIKTDVLYASATIKDLKTQKDFQLTGTNGEDILTLPSNNYYELTMRKTGYDPLKSVFKTGYADTVLSYNWQPYEKKEILLRSLALPGWGQRYSGRNVGWQWTVATALSVTAVGVSAYARSANITKYDEYNEKYLTEQNEYSRSIYDENRKVCQDNIQTANGFLIGSISTTILVWGANLLDVAIFSPGPRTNISLDPVNRRGRVEIKF